MEYFLILIIMIMIIRITYPIEFNFFLLNIYFKLLEIQQKLEKEIKELEEKEKKENDNK